MRHITPPPLFLNFSNSFILKPVDCDSNYFYNSKGNRSGANSIGIETIKNQTYEEDLLGFYVKWLYWLIKRNLSQSLDRSISYLPKIYSI